MGKAFRWIGEGVLKDIVGGRVVVHMGRRLDATGHVLEGEIVREHTIDAAKLDAWVKDGRAEYVNLVENVVDKVGGSKPSAESERESAIHQQSANHTEAAVRVQALGDLRRITDDLDADARGIAEMELAETATADITAFLDLAQRERDKRRPGADKPKGRGKKPADTDLDGAGPGGAK